MSSAKEAKLLWDEFFTDPSQFWDNRNDKRSSNSPDFRHKITRKPLWIDGWHTPPSVEIKLKEIRSHSDDGYSQGLRFHDDRVNLLDLIKSCGINKNLSKVKEIHAKALYTGLIVKDAYIATALIRTYAKCGALEEALEVFERIPARNVVSWTALISGYVEHGQGHQALECFRKMRDEGVRPSAITYACLLKACGIVRFLDVGECIDIEIRKQGLLKKDVVLGTALVDMYSKCGALEKAQEVFDELPNRNVVTWNALITGYVQHGLGDEALRCFRRMRDEEVCSPNALSYASILKACGMVKSLDTGECIDADIRKEGLLEKDVVLGTALVDMYSKCGALQKAQEVFDHLSVRDVVTWNALIAGYTQYGFGDEALECFRKMQDEGVRPNSVTYISTLKACGLVRSLEIGKAIDAEVRKQGLLAKNVALGNTLVGMYAKCGALEKAEEVFENMWMRNAVSWNALIAGYVEQGLGLKAIKCFRQMQDDEVVCPDTVTYISVLKACGIIRSVEIGEDIHCQVRKEGLLHKDIMLGTAFVDMYSKCGALEKAREVFEQLPGRNVVTWNVLITGYAHHSLGDEVLECFREMKDEGVCPDVVTYMCVLKASGILGSVKIGEDIDAEIRKQNLLPKDVVLGTALLDMYSKCGTLMKSREVFEELPVKSIVPWNALIAGYAQLGEVNVVLDLYGKMQTEGIMPDSVTFIVLLTACSHAGLLEDGEKVFDEMLSVHHLTPTVEHYTCMVDLFGRAGHSEKAKGFLDKVSHSDRLPLLLTILATCQNWIDVNLGRWAFEQSIRLDEKCTAAFICMQNIYAASGMQNMHME